MVFLCNDLDSDEKISTVTTEFMPLHFVVRIESCSLLSKNGIDKYECTEFEAGSYKWRLVIYPNGKESTTDGVSVYLSVAEPKSLEISREINVMFGIFLQNHTENSFLCKRRMVPCRFNALSPAWGFAKFISKTALFNPLNGYLVNDTCVFGADVFVFERPGTIERLSLTEAEKPYVRSWTISDFSKIKNEWMSENFTAAGHNWFIYLIPGGFGEAEGRSISLYLCLVNEENQFSQKVKTKYTLRIKDQNGNKHREFIGLRNWFESLKFKKKRNWFKSFDIPHSAGGKHEFMPIADMNDPTKGFLVMDCCIIEIEITVIAVARCSQ